MNGQTDKHSDEWTKRERKRQNDGQPSEWTGRQRGNERKNNTITDGWTNREGEGLKGF
jgi:hypothetical protein